MPIAEVATGRAGFDRFVRKVVLAAGPTGMVHLDSGDPPGLAMKLDLDGNEYILTLIPARSTGSLLRRVIDAGIRTWRGE